MLHRVFPLFLPEILASGTQRGEEKGHFVLKNSLDFSD
jgi:hypothetical protein